MRHTHIIENFLGNIKIMQNNMKKTQSQLIKNTEELKIKTRRRLIGSIVLLLIAVFILLKINYKDYNNKNNIAIKVIKNNESNLNSIKLINSNNKNISLESNIKPIESIYSQNKIVESINLNNNLESSIQKNQVKLNDHKNQHNKHFFKPKIVIDIANSHNPDDILNNINLQTKRFYVQFIALDNKEKILLEKKYLQELGIKTILSQVEIKNKIFYRLRSNSFNSKEKVAEYLNNINNKLG